MSELQKALDDLRHSRAYARKALDDEDIARENVAERGMDLLEAIAEHLLNGAP